MKRTVRVLLEFIGIFAICAVLLFVAANWQALLEKVGWWFGSERYNHDQVSGLGQKTEFIPADDRLVIPKLAINAPLLFPDSADEGALLESLQDGVVHYPGTALPGQSGNFFVTGHSSQLAWQAGHYKDVFALLDKLESGDSVLVYYHRTKYTYEVTGERTVGSSEVSILEPSQGATLSLMTCWPVGTIAKRLVVSARLTSRPPTSGKPLGGGEARTPAVLPAVR